MRFSISFLVASLALIAQFALAAPISGQLDVLIGFKSAQDLQQFTAATAQSTDIKVINVWNFTNTIQVYATPARVEELKLKYSNTIKYVEQNQTVKALEPAKNPTE
jgi:hypothetical protein